MANWWTTGINWLADKCLFEDEIVQGWRMVMESPGLFSMEDWVSSIFCHLTNLPPHFSEEESGSLLHTLHHVRSQSTYFTIASYPGSSPEKRGGRFDHVSCDVAYVCSFDNQIMAHAVWLRNVQDPLFMRLQYSTRCSLGSFNLLSFCLL